MKQGRRQINQRIESVEGAQKALSIRLGQLRRAMFVLSDDGKHLHEYMKDVRSSLLHERSLCKPDDAIANAICHGQLDIVDRVLREWDDPTRLYKTVKETIEDNQKELDKLHEL